MKEGVPRRRGEGRREGNVGMKEVQRRRKERKEWKVRKGTRKVTEDGKEEGKKERKKKTGNLESSFRDQKTYRQRCFGGVLCFAA